MRTKRCPRWTVLTGALVVGSLLAVAPPARAQSIEFDLVRSAGAVNANCLPEASGQVTVVAKGEAEVMDIAVSGLPPRTAFDVFVIQVPNAPFGLSWYQGDVVTNARGRGRVRFAGRFNAETFIVAPNVAPAPVVHDDGPTVDAPTNPATGPVHTYHIGLWFDRPEDAVAAGCAGTVTPFNGEHNAGGQALSTRNFPDDQGPLRQLAR